MVRHTLDLKNTADHSTTAVQPVLQTVVERNTQLKTTTTKPKPITSSQLVATDKGTAIVHKIGTLPNTGAETVFAQNNQLVVMNSLFPTTEPKNQRERAAVETIAAGENQLHRAYGTVEAEAEPSNLQIPQHRSEALGAKKTTIRVAITLGSKTLDAIMDEGAERSIMPYHLVEEIIPRGTQMRNPPLLGTVNSSIKALGEWDTQLNFGHVQTPITWCLVDTTTAPNLSIPLVGMDFIQEYDLDRRMGRACYVGKDPATGKIFKIPMLDFAIKLRASKAVKLRTGTMALITCNLGGTDGTDDDVGVEMLIEPAPTTCGALRTRPKLIHLKGNQDSVVVEVMNYNHDSITVQAGALLGYLKTIEDVGTEIDATKFVHSIQSYNEHLEEQRDQKIREINGGPQLTRNESKKFKAFMENYIGTPLFSPNPSAPNAYKGPKFTMKVNGPPLSSQPNRAGPAQLNQIQNQLQEMLENNIIEPSTSPWSAPVVMAKKKDGSWRFCVDYRRINAVTEKDVYALPRIDDTLDAIGSGNRYYSSLDISSGYWHIPVEDLDKEKTAFTCREGTYQFKVLPFGLTNAPAMFHRAIDNCLRDLLYKFVLVFVDDILVYTKDFDSHLNALEAVFAKLIDWGFSLKLSKCTFCSDSVHYLGYVLKEGSITVDPKKVESIAQFHFPMNTKSLQRYLGMASWYRRFIPRFSDIAAPLFELLKKEADPNPDRWQIHVQGTPQNHAFEELRAALMTHPVLRLPDFKKPFLVICDASAYAVGGFLAQIHEGFEHPIAYISKAHKLKTAHSYEQETYALVVCLKAFRHYLLENDFTVVTDCRALSYFNSKKKQELSPKVERWLSLIQSFRITFIHREGKLMHTADTLSRDDRFNDSVAPNGTWTGLKMDPVMIQYSPITSQYEDVMQIGNADIEEAQKNDRHLRKLASFLERKEFPEKSTETEQQTIREQAKSFATIKGILYRIPEPGTFGTTRPYIPTPLQQRILEALHDDPLAGHQGVYRTQQRVSSRFYWPTMNSDVADYVKNCPSCNLNKKLGNPRRTTLQPVKLSSPWRTVQMDYAGPFPETHQGLRFILVMVDIFSKAVELLGQITADSRNAKIGLKTRVVCRWGTPETVMTDGGSHFKGEFKDYLDQLKIHHDVSLPYQSNTNGVVERMNRTVEQTLRHYTGSDFKDWDTHLLPVQFAINTAVAKATGLSPYLLLFGREPRLPLDNSLKLIEQPKEVEIDTLESDNTERLESIAKERIQTYQQKMIDNNPGTLTTFKPGSYVMRQRPRPAHKFDVVMEGPYRIVEQNAQRPANYLVENPWVGFDSRRMFHTTELREYKGSIDKRVLTRQQAIKNSAYKPQRKPYLKMAQKATSAPWSLVNVIGRRIKVKWSQLQGSWYTGEIVDYSPEEQKHWIRYDQASKDGTRHYLEGILHPAKGPNWEFTTDNPQNISEPLPAREEDLNH